MRKHVILLKILKNVKLVLEKHSIDYWLDCGTLLGAIRDGQLIKWDTDIDIGCWKNKNDYLIKKILRKEFMTLGYNVYLTDYFINIHDPKYSNYNVDINFYSKYANWAITPSNCLLPYLKDPLPIFINHLIRFIYNNRLYLKKYHSMVKYFIKIYFSLIRYIFLILPPNWQDIFLDKLIILRQKLTDHKNEAVEKHYFWDLVQFNVFNGAYPVPKKYREYLTCRYGSNWETPIQKWDNAKQDKTVKHLSEL